MRYATIFLAAICLPVCSAWADWPGFGGPHRDFTLPEAELDRSWPENGPERLWTVKTGPGFGGPAIFDGKVYLLDRDGQTGDVLRCLDLKTGREEYRVAYEAPGKLSYHGSRSTPAVTEDHVLTVGPFGHFRCHSRAEGKLLWSKHLLDDFGGRLPRWGVAQSPVVIGKKVIVAPQSDRVGLAAFDITTGKQIWTSPSVGRMQYATPLLTRLAGREQLVILAGDGASGIDPDTGKLLWKYAGWRCRNAIPQPQVFDHDKLFITGGYGAGSACIQIRRNDAGYFARQVYKTDQINAQMASPLLYEGNLYIIGNGNRYKDGLMCVEPAGGRTVWKTGERFLGRGQMLRVGELLLAIHGKEGTLHLIDPSPEGFKQLAETKLLGGKNIWAPMALSDGLLVLRDQSQMRCVRIGRASPSTD